MSFVDTVNTIDAAEDAGFALTAQQQWRLNALKDECRWADAAIFLSIDIEVSLDVHRLQRAFEQLQTQYPVLCAQLRKQEMYLRVRQFFAQTENAVPLRVYEDVETTKRKDELLHEWYARSIDVERLPVIEALLVRCSINSWHLVIGVARFIIDDRGVGFLYEKLVENYKNDNYRKNHQAFSESVNAFDASATDADEGTFEQYVEWHHEVVVDEDAEGANAYWQEYFSQGMDLQVPLHLPYRLEDRISSIAGISAIARTALHKQVPSAELVQALDNFARVANHPMELILQAAWWLLLARISDRMSFVAAISHNARTDYEYFSSAVGLFEKTLPMVVQIDEKQSFQSLLDKFNDTLNTHATYQEYWSPLTGFTTTPRVGFSANTDLPVQHVEGAIWTPQFTADLSSSFELLLKPSVDVEGRLSELELIYQREHYSEISVAGLLEQYCVLLQNIVNDAATSVGRLSLLGDAERQRLLSLNPSRICLDNLPLLPEKINAWAATQPDIIAVLGNTAGGKTGSETQLTYSELQTESDLLASYLQQQGIDAGAIVALALPRSTALIVAMLAVWRIGAAYLPLDPQWPVARKKCILEQSSARLVLTSTASTAEFSEAEIPVHDIVQARKSVADNFVFQPHEISADDAAYVLFTSGSTGNPKGVVIEHRQLRNYVEAVTQQLELNSCRHVAFSSTVAADLGHTALYGALYNGATLHIANDEVMQSPSAFANYIKERSIDCIKVVPSHLAALLDIDDAVLPKMVVLGGEPVAAALVERIRRIRPDCSLYNHYGPTETTVGVLVHAIDSNERSAHRFPLTQVLANNEIYLLDAEYRPVATGELGEVFIGGQQLCRGYSSVSTDSSPNNGSLENDSAKNSPFIKNPFNDGERLYATGDLARYRPEGGIQLYGRRDHQVKIRGFRIELAEIEVELKRFAEIAEAVALIDAAQDAGAMAFVTLARGASVEALDAIKIKLAANLPAAMVPRRLQWIEHMPRLGNGKIDRRALEEQIVLVLEHVYHAPRSALETLLAKRMAQLLGLDRLSIDLDFFAAGGHSLLVIKLAASIRKQLHCEINAHTVFDHPTAASLAEILLTQELAPGELERKAAARLRFEALTPEQQAAMQEKARALKNISKSV